MITDVMDVGGAQGQKRLLVTAARRLDSRRGREKLKQTLP